VVSAVTVRARPVRGGHCAPLVGRPTGRRDTIHPEEPAATLRAYLACALTGLTDDQRDIVFAVSDLVARSCADAGIGLYEPRMQTDPVWHPEVPDAEVFAQDRDRVIGSDLLIFLADNPSTGSGEELAFAADALVPVLVLARSATRVSRMVTGLPGVRALLRYDDHEQLRAALAKCLDGLRPELAARRRHAAAVTPDGQVGARVRRLRTERGLSPDGLAERVRALGHELPIEVLARIEAPPGGVSNPSLRQLGVIAAALDRTVADLLTP
jgi:hypothetical protein